MSTGWEISFYRQASNPKKPATPWSQRGTRVAIWQAWSAGLDWIDRLVAAAQCIHAGEDGYTTHWYPATASVLLPYLMDGHFIASHFKLKHVVDVNPQVAADCSPDEWLLIEAVDIS